MHVYVKIKYSPGVLHGVLHLNNRTKLTLINMFTNLFNIALNKTRD